MERKVVTAKHFKRGDILSTHKAKYNKPATIDEIYTIATDVMKLTDTIMKLNEKPLGQLETPSKRKQKQTELRTELIYKSFILECASLDLCASIYIAEEVVKTIPVELTQTSLPELKAIAETIRNRGKMVLWSCIPYLRQKRLELMTSFGLYVNPAKIKEPTPSDKNDRPDYDVPEEYVKESLEQILEEQRIKYSDVAVDMPKTLINNHAVMQSIKTALFTQRGERIFRPEVGSELEEHLWGQIDDDSAEEVKMEVLATISQDPRAEVQMLEVYPNSDSTGYVVKLGLLVDCEFVSDEFELKKK